MKLPLRSWVFEDPVGKKAKLWGGDVEIVGVVKDFNMQSLHEDVAPMFFHLTTSNLTNIVVKIKAGTENKTLKELEQRYAEFNPGYSLNYRFLDQDYRALYEAENRVSVLSRYFAGLAIIISCLGLFGLAAFTAERKRKEIGIRRALGQGSTQISLLLSSEFAKLVIISTLIGLPVAYLLAKDWLSDFAYRIPLNAGYFLLAGITALTIAMLTVSTQTVRAAHGSPVEALREE